jgi:hypothetical protein
MKLPKADGDGKVLLCSECFAEIGGGSCRDHPDDPPLDPARPEVRDMLADKDDEALARLRRKLMGVGAIPGVITLFVMVVLDAASDFALPRSIVAGPFVVVTLAGLTFGRRMANRRFKPRYARWTGCDYHMGEDIEEMIRKTRGWADED